jgi:molybdopterin-binding protein
VICGKQKAGAGKNFEGVSAEEMKLKIGDTGSAVIKSTEVMLEKK